MSDFKRIIEAKKSVIVAADLSSGFDLATLVRAVCGIPGIGGIKLGFSLGLQNLADAVRTIKANAPAHFKIIYDHQKAGNDIPDMGLNFAAVIKYAGVDAAILFPFTGPATQERWTKECFAVGLDVLVGGVMTHKQFLVSEGGYIADEAVLKIYRQACKDGVRHFVVPGTKLNWVKEIRQELIKELGEGNFALYAPGFISQGGDISECGQAAGDEWHAIVGSAIYGKEKINAYTEMREAATIVTRQITGG